MYVVLVTSKSRNVLSDVIPELKKEFPADIFSIYGSEEKGYQLRLEGAGDERAPRAMVIKFMKTHKHT